MLSTSTIPSTIEMHNGCIVPYEAETFAPYISEVRAVPFKAETPDLHYGDTLPHSGEEAQSPIWQ